MSNYPKQKGTSAENQAVSWLRRWWSACERRALAGMLDKGDIAGTPYVVSVKHHKSWRTFEWLDDLKKQMKNAGIADGFVMARRPSRQGFIFIVPEQTMAHLLDAAYGAGLVKDTEEEPDSTALYF